MREPLFSSSDIDTQTLIYIDRYLKLTISNTKRNFLRNKFRYKQYGITLVTLDDFENELVYEEPGFEDAICEWVSIHEIKIPIHSSALALALKSLSYQQRIILLQNIVLKIPLEKIASELGIGLRMVSRHKHNAIVKLKRSLQNYGKEL